MSANLSTSNRMFFLTLQEYGEDDLLIQQMSGTEAMSTLFEFRLTLFSSRDDIDVRKIIGKTAILRIETYDTHHMGGERHWNGYVSRFVRAGRASSADGEDLYTYECDIVPWFWFMTQHEDCRIFQRKSVRDIIETIFGEFNYSDFKMELTEDHPTLEYCTQYRETTFDFISRLIEREGIHYYFRHNEGDDSKHILVFSDNNDSNPQLDPDELPFHHEGVAEGSDAIRTLALEQQMRTSKVTLGDWDFEKKRLVREDTPTVLDIGRDHQLERYRYPGGFVESADGQHLSRMIMEAEEASHLTLRGDSQIRTLAPGHTFTLYDHPFDALNVEYMVLSVRHYGLNNLNNSSPADYANSFTIHPHAITFRAPLSTPRGLVRGPQTALVTGPAGEEIHTDAHGRIKVQFHWDRQGQYDDKSSCWVRVAQVWAGNGYGTMFIPRVGMEVVVDFLEGDPDQPLVTGCVYNGVNKPPYDLPANATRSTLKTLSSKGGGGTNELRFEDKKGSEEVFIQAEKDFNVKVKASKHEGIGGNSDLKIEGYSRTKIEGTHDLVVDTDSVTWVAGECKIGSEGNLQILSKDEARLLGSNQVQIASKGNIQVHGGKELVMEALTKISLKVGPSGIVIDGSGVSVVGPIIKQNSGGAPSAAITSEKQHSEFAQGAHSTKDGTVTDPGQQLQAQALMNAAREGQPFCAECAAARAAYEALMA